MLTGNKLKIIACLTMLIDHIGLFLFPEALWLRYIGRIAFPLFAFFIAEGCRYTRDRFRYFLNVFVLAVLCQSVYFVEMLINGIPDRLYLNVLFTFSISIVVCSLFFKLKASVENRACASTVIINAELFALSIVFSYILSYALENAFAVSLRIEYGFFGVILPLFAAFFKNRYLRLLSFAVGVVLFCFDQSLLASFAWFALIAVPIIALYSGSRGSKQLKYAFYLFYPVQFGVLYIISALI